MNISTSTGFTLSINEKTREFMRLSVEYRDIDSEKDFNSQLKEANALAKLLLEDQIKLSLAMAAQVSEHNASVDLLNCFKEIDDKLQELSNGLALVMRKSSS